MFISAYDTTVAKSLRLETLEKEIRKYLIHYTPRLETTPELLPITPDAVDVPQFAHPLIIAPNTKVGETLTRYAFDARNSTRIERGTGKLTIVARDEYEFQRMRAALTWYVDKHDITDLGGISQYPMQLFAMWISEALSRRFGLDPQVQMRASIILAIYFLCMLRESTTDFTDKERTLYAGLINRVMRVPPREIDEIISTIAPMRNVQDLVSALVNQTDSIRLQELNVPILYMLLGGSWFGFNAREVIAVSLEHIPTFYAIAYASATKVAFKKAILSKMTERLTKQGHVTTFVQSLSHIPELSITQ